ncbi:MAG TPA: hypothetical protein VLB67_00320 [Acidimicrobiia bacterium]|nr:hypothetical protein [Acidimicrobiia bacterium]
MIDLDDRARSAAAALRRSVRDAELVLAEPPTTRPQAPRAFTPGWALAAGAATVLVLVVGMWSIRPAIVADDVDVATTTTVTPTTAPTTTPTTTAPPPSLVPAVPASSATVPITDVTPPALSILSPVDGQIFTETHVTFAGVTEPGARVLAGPYEARVGADGSWSIVLVLSEGSNRATFTAIDDAGNTSTASVTAVYQPPSKPTEPTKEPVKDPSTEPAPFLAHATWQQSSAVPPYDEYHGTGEPGSLVKVVSEWGTGDTVVGSDGRWYVKVTFPKAPHDVTFEVKVKDSLGRYSYFTMTARS